MYYPKDDPQVEIIDYWFEDDTKTAYCIYIDLKMTEFNHKTSNLRLAEGKYDDGKTF